MTLVYTGSSMRGRLILAALAVFVSLVPVYAVTPGYQRGTIVAVEQKAHTRILYYLVNTPITQDDPYFEVSLKLGPTSYLCEYTPTRQRETLPDDWKPATEIEAKVKGRHISVRRPGGDEVDLIWIKKSVPKADAPDK
jgi:hypothetical protein